MSRIEAQSPQGNVQEGQRLMVIELKKYNKVRTLLRDVCHRFARTHTLLEWRPEGICNYGSCLHGGEGDRDANRSHGSLLEWYSCQPLSWKWSWSDQ